MNKETLERANKLKTEIDHTKKMISALEAPYMNSIRAVNYWGDKETTEVCIFERDSILYETIINHFKNILTEQQKEFDAL